MRLKPVDIRAMAMFLAVTFLAAGALGTLQPATRIPGEVIQLTQFGPALGVGVAALLWPRRVRALLAGALPGRSSHGVLLIVTAPLIIALSVGAYATLTGNVQLTRPDTPFALIAAAQLIGACGEEIGWRCFLQPLLRTRFGPFGASVAVGVAWGVWHVQVFARHPVYAGAFLMAAVSMSVVMGWALEGVRASRLLLAGGFHALINLGMLLFMDEESGAVLPMVLFGASCLVAAGLWTWTSSRSGRSPSSASALAPATGTAPTPTPTKLPPIMDDVR
ncbi:CPBP family intramembrane glutamic endopeptidase [Streptomyces sp. NPDC054841]